LVIAEELNHKCRLTLLGVRRTTTFNSNKKKDTKMLRTGGKDGKYNPNKP